MEGKLFTCQWFCKADEYGTTTVRQCFPPNHPSKLFNTLPVLRTVGRKWIIKSLHYSILSMEQTTRTPP